MRELFASRRFVQGVLIPWVVWMLFWLAYLIGSSAFEFTPIEQLILVCGLILPVCLLFFGFSLYGWKQQAAAITRQLCEQGNSTQASRRSIDSILDILHEAPAQTERDIRTISQLAEDMATLKASHKADFDALKQQLAEGPLAGIAENFGAELAGLGERLDVVVQNQADRKGNIDFSEISQQTALAGLMNFVLGDVNVCATRVLVQLMEKEQRPHSEIRDFIQRLSGAYAAGDRNVFFSVLLTQLDGNDERFILLQSLIQEIPSVASDISKITREGKEVLAMTKLLEPQDMAAILFDDTHLSDLVHILELFNWHSGSPKQPVSETGSG
jgi:hypothetical protein